MKKVLALVLMASMAEILCSFSHSGAFGLGTPGGKPSDYLQVLPKDSQITQRCGNENKEACDIIRNYLAISSGFERGLFSGIDRKKLHEALDILVDADRKIDEEKNVDVAVQKLIDRMIV